MSTTNDNLIVHPYMCFEGRCEEALEYYKRALGAEVTMLMRFKECPEPPAPGCAVPGTENKIMHSQFKVGQSIIMASDGRCGGKANFQGVSFALSVKSDAEADQYFKALAEGGQVQMPLAKTFFSSKFGMVADKFGVSWMIMVRLG